MRSVEAEGSSIDEAITGALRALGAAREQVEVEILENARRGVFGFGRRAARVRATMRAPMRWSEEAIFDDTPGPVAEPPPEPAGDRRRRKDVPVAPHAEVSPDLDGPALLSEILTRMRLDATVEERRAVNGERTLIVSGRDASDAVGRQGEVLDALEYLVNRISERAGPNAPRFTLEAEGYRERRRQTLATLAERTAEKARRKRKPVTLSPMNPEDRRAMQAALRAESGISIRSVGQGFYRKLVIIPEGAKPRSGKSRR